MSFSIALVKRVKQRIETWKKEGSPTECLNYRPFHLVTEFTLGDRASGQLLRELKQIVSDIVGTELVKSLWLQRLLESLSEHVRIRGLWAHSPPPQTKPTRSTREPWLARGLLMMTQLQKTAGALTTTVSELTEAVGALRWASRTRSRSRFASRKTRSASASTGEC